LIEDAVMVQLLNAAFFPRWQQALYAWMKGTPDFGQVQRWYQGWKSLLPEGIVAHPAIKQQFTQALDLMNAAVAGQDLAALDPAKARAPQRPSGAFRGEERKPAAGARGQPRERSFKEVVEEIAAGANMVLMPTKMQHESGKLIYSFGPKLKIYMDNSVVFYQDGDNRSITQDGNWRPIGLDDIAALAEARRLAGAKK